MDIEAAPAPTRDEGFERRYVDLDEVNTGQVSCSFRATDTVAGARVFLKALNLAVLSDESAVRIFLHEPITLRALARRAPQLRPLPVLDLGRWNERPYFTQPLLLGWSLDPVVKANACFHPRSAMRVVEACLQSLEILHGAGYTHGDISPDNIFIETAAPPATGGVLPADCVIRMVDFNSVRQLDRSDGDLAPFIKPNYVSPEVAMGEPATIQSDLYALGMVFYQLLAGNVPYRLKQWTDAVKVLLQDNVPPIPASLEVPRAIEALIRRLLARDRRERPASASECLRTLGDLYDVSAWLARTGPPDAAILGTPFKPVVVGDSRVGTALRGAPRPPDRPPESRSGTVIRSSPPPPPAEHPPPGISAVEPDARSDTKLLPLSEDAGPQALVPGTGAAPPPAPSAAGAKGDTRLGPGPPDVPAYMRRAARSDVPDERSAVLAVPVPPSVARQARPDRVDFSVFAPALVTPGRSFVLEVWAYLRAQREEMMERATLAERVERGIRGPVAVTRGTELTLVLRLDGFEISDNQDTIGWEGEVTNVPFVVNAPAGLAHGVHPGQISILHCGMLLSRLVFDLAVGTAAEAGARGGDAARDQRPWWQRMGGRKADARPAALGVREERVTTAFASYASQDRAEVLRRVQGIEAAGVQVFMDVLSLRAGQDWERRILDNIRHNDVFYLFWSVPASRSEWVEKEWRLALRERGVGYIHPIPLADPSDAPPPRELASRHFNDLVLACLRSQAATLPAREPS